MRVFRSKLGLWLALLALTTQLVVSFGHIHWRASASASPLLPQAGSLVADNPAVPTLPAGITLDACAVCTLAGLGGVAPSAPALPLPVAPLLLRQVSIDQPPTASPHRLFQSRAPPQA